MLVGSDNKQAQTIFRRHFGSIKVLTASLQCVFRDYLIQMANKQNLVFGVKQEVIAAAIRLARSAQGLLEAHACGGRSGEADCRELEDDDVAQGDAASQQPEDCAQRRQGVAAAQGNIVVSAGEEGQRLLELREIHKVEQWMEEKYRQVARMYGEIDMVLAELKNWLREERGVSGREKECEEIEGWLALKAIEEKSSSCRRGRSSSKRRRRRRSDSSERRRSRSGSKRRRKTCRSDSVPQRRSRSSIKRRRCRSASSSPSRRKRRRRRQDHHHGRLRSDKTSE